MQRPAFDEDGATAQSASVSPHVVADAVKGERISIESDDAQSGREEHRADGTQHTAYSPIDEESSAES